MNKKMVCIVFGIIVCLMGVAPVIAEPTPFVIYGYVFDSGSNPCNGPTVQILNQNTGASWYAKNATESNYYQLVLANGTDLNASEVLRITVTNPDGTQSKVIESWVAESEVDDGGRFVYNITLSVPNQQTWYFTNDSVTGPTWSGATYNRTMTKGVEGGDEKITLAPGERVWFYADHVAESNVSFPAGTWNVSYWVKTLNTTESSKNLYTRLQNVTPDGEHTEVKGGWNAISGSANMQENVESLEAGSFTVPEGGRFAVEVFWSSSANGNLEVYCNPPEKQSSQVTSPSSDPGYPIPELPTIILFGVGLLVISGYVGWFKRRRDRPSV